MADLKIYKIITDVTLLLIVFAVYLVVTLFCEPFHRGFFCNDESIKYPHKDETISTALLTVLGLSIPIISIILNESFLYVLSRKRQEKNSYNKCHYIKTKKVNPLLYYLYYIIGVFLFGSATTQLATACIKKLIGRLRPHFLTVCIPNYDLFNCSDGYIEADVCTGDPHIISEARLSFLSGHSSLAWFSALYLALYLEVRFVWNLPKLVKPTLQFTSLMLGLLCSLTRISDYYHHPTDVLWGSLLGIVIALLTYVYISGLLKMHMAIPGRHRYAETEQSKQEHIDIPKTETEDVIETGLPC